MKPVITAFETAPDRGRGLVRDLRVRWALEEVGRPYEVRLLSFAAMKQPAHLAIHPFGQIPTYEDGDVALFESGAIVLHIAERHPGLLPEAPAARSRAIAWMFAAIGTIEPPLVNLGMAKLFERDRPWYDARLPLLQAAAHRMLAPLADRLGDADWLDGDFSAGDLMTIGVLFRAKPTGILDDYPNLLAYLARGEARPAFGRAFDAQRAVFEASESS